jgi:hypothetical protein
MDYFTGKVLLQIHVPRKISDVVSHSGSLLERKLKERETKRRKRKESKKGKSGDGMEKRKGKEGKKRTLGAGNTM